MCQYAQLARHFTALSYGQFEHSSMCESSILLSSLQLFTPIRNGICHLRKRTVWLCLLIMY